MLDLYLACFLVLAAMAGVFAGAYRLGKRAPRWLAHAAAIFSVAGLWLFHRYVLDEAFATKLLPFSNVLVLGNALPLFGAFLAGLAWARIQGSRLRKAFSVVPLLAVACYAMARPLSGATPKARDRWQKGVCMQTSFQSCGAACAATLLKAHGIEANEAEMIEACVTRDRGTLNHGLFRGLKRKTAGTAWDAEMFDGTLEDLRAPNGAPAILIVELPKDGNPDPRYEQEWGWIPGVRHSVVFYGFGEDGRLEIGDPAVGREFWHAEALKVLWQGQGLRLKKR